MGHGHAALPGGSLPVHQSFAGRPARGGDTRIRSLSLTGCPNMPLTATAIRKAKPTEKPRKIYDSRGLYLEIAPRGTKAWRSMFSVSRSLRCAPSSCACTRALTMSSRGAARRSSMIGRK